jgi:hypothetical protein
MNSACPPWDDRQRLPRCPLCCRGGQPGPATHLQFVQAAVKMENAPDLSLRGGRRPTRRPERAARGSALGVQSWEGTHDFADDFPVIQLGAARFPRRFAPRNDNRGSIFGRRWCIPTCSCQRRSLSAATDAIGAYRFNGGRYGLHVQRRARLSAPQLVKKVPLDFLDKLLSELQNQILQHDFAILPLRRVI